MMSKTPEKPSDFVKWETKNEDLIDKYVSAFMKILNFKNGEVSTTDSFHLSIYIRILGQNIEFREIDGLDIKYGLIYRAAFRLRKYRNQDILKFQRILAVEVRKYLHRPINQYWILFPLHVAAGQLAQYRSFTVFGEILRVANWVTLSRKLRIERFFDDARMQLQDRNAEIFLQTSFTPIIIKSEGRNEREAFDNADQAFDLFRGLLNLLYQFGRITTRWGGYPQPLGYILQPPVYGVFHSNGEYSEFLYNTAKGLTYNRNTIATEIVQGVRKLIKQIGSKQEKNDTKQLIIDSITKYKEALDTTEWRLAYLSLWQILELLTLQSADQINMRIVINRINILLRQDQTARDLLSTLYSTRNALVHQGTFPDERALEEVNLLKYIAERSINSVFAHSRTLKNIGSLARFYDHASSSDADLIDRQRVIKYISQQRQKRGRKK